MTKAKHTPWRVSPLTEPFIGIGDVIIEGTHLGRPQEMCTVHVLYSLQQESEDSAQNIPDEIATTNLVNNILASPALLSACELALDFFNKPGVTVVECKRVLTTAINLAKPKGKETR